MAFLTAQWRKLAIANYTIAPDLLQPFLPAGTSIDLWKDRCYVSLVGFRFINTKLLGIPVPFHRNFEEINLRFYVKRQDKNEMRRGVVFIKEIVPRPALTIVANAVYKEHYETLPTRSEIKTVNDELHVSYSWKKSAWNKFSVVAENQLLELLPGSEAEFITEHYWGYTKLGQQATSEYAVQHPKWQIYSVKDFSIDVDFKAVYGPPFGLLNEMQPSSVMLAEGSAISGHAGK